MTPSELIALLCFLVPAQLIGHTSIGSWFRTDNVTKSARLWMTSNSTECNWIERAKLARISLDLASPFLTSPRFSVPWFMYPRMKAEMFVDG